MKNVDLCVLKLLKSLPKAAYSWSDLSLASHRSIWGKNSQKLVNITNPTVNAPETTFGIRHVAGRALFNAISTVKHSPCRTKNHVISHVGRTRPK